MTARPLPLRLLLLVLAAHFQEHLLIVGYNIDVSFPTILSGTNTSQNFGYQVLQFGKGKAARILVGAPANSSIGGGLFQCTAQKDSCKPVTLPENFKATQLGMTLASDALGDRFIACDHELARECDRNMYLSGICSIFQGRLEQPKEITPGYQDCLKGNVDLLFLFDGSGSMNTEQFSKIKEFMIDVMKKLSNGTIRFAAVQFSEEPKVEFDFKDYSQNPNPEKLLANVRHMTSLTNTFKAIEYVAEQVFTPARGLRDEAKRVIVMITDGDATDTGNVEAAKKNGITRYVIGVGNNFGGHDTQRYLSQFASEPVSQYVKVLRSFEELKDLFSELQEKIYDIEGTNDKNIFHLELSLSGFSAHLSKGRVVLGAVGADNWAGGLFDMMGEKTEETFKFIPSPLPKEQMKDAYLGYALTSLHHQERVLYAVGAPRYIHEGRVVIFDVDPTTSNWTQKQHIAGTQIGSYFGSVLCSVDLEGDGQTDFLLVGAPQFFSEHQGGQVYVYSWAEDQLIPSGQLYGDLGHPLGRFGAAISELTDINGDGLTDTAVGAPLEDDESGAVYIYNSQKGALSEHYSQRINGAVLSPGLKYFGQSINGWTDLNDDSLTDITVGAQGKVFVLSSRPIVMVLPFAEFSPMEIPIEQVECTGSLVAREDIELKVCFNTSRVTQSYSGPLLANLTYVMEIDPKRMKGRGIFPNGMRKTSGNISISVGGHCVRETIQIPNCLEDYVSAIHVALNFSLLENSHAAISAPVLEPLSNVLLVEIPFKKNCGEDEVCKADLIITVHPSGSQKLVVSPSSVLTVALELENQGEDAYRAVLHVPHIPELSFRKVAVHESSGAHPSVTCNRMLEAQDVKFRNLSCNVSHPIYREKTRTVIHLLFGVLVNGSWGERLDMEATVSSDNEETGTLGNNKAVLSFPIQYPISIIAIGLDNSTQYMNFTSQLQNQTMRHSYQVKNMQLGLFPAPSLQVYLMASMKLTLGLAWQVESVETDSAEPCTSVDMARETPETAAIRSRRKTINQYSAHEYKIFRCNISQINTSLIHINGVVSVPKKIEKSSRSLFCTTLWFTFDTKRYTHLSSEITESQIITEVELVYVMNYLPIYIGSSIGGLFLLVLIVFVLYKLGFFKRSYKERRDHEPNAKNGVGAAEDGVGAAADAAGSGEDGECSVPLDENKED